MRKVQTGNAKPEQLNSMAELGSSAWLHTTHARDNSLKGRAEKPGSPRRKSFFDTVAEHAKTATEIDKTASRMNVNTSSKTIPQRVQQFNIGMS